MKPNEKDVVRTIVNDIAEMNYRGDIKAIGTVVIDKDGDMRILFGFEEGTKLPLIAGTVILQRDIAASAQIIEKDRD